MPYDSRWYLQGRRRRIRLFCQIYGWKEIEQLPQVVETRLMALAELIKEKADTGDVAFMRMLEEGHQNFYLEEIDFHREHSREYFGN